MNQKHHTESTEKSVKGTNTYTHTFQSAYIDFNLNCPIYIWFTFHWMWNTSCCSSLFGMLFGGEPASQPACHTFICSTWWAIVYALNQNASCAYVSIRSSVWGFFHLLCFNFQSIHFLFVIFSKYYLKLFTLFFFSTFNTPYISTPNIWNEQCIRFQSKDT